MGGSLEVAGAHVAGPGFEQEVRLFLGGVCPTGWTEATETMGKLLASRGGSETAGASKDKAGISATDAGSHKHNQGYGSTSWQTGSATITITTSAPNSFVLLLCKRN